MKKILYLVASIVIIVNLAACNINSKSTTINIPVNTESAVIKSAIYPKSILFDDYESKFSVGEKNTVDNGFTNSVNYFSYKTLSKILSNQTKNISYSPVSLYMALAIAGTGANGATQDEIFSALGVSGKGIDFLSKQNGNLFRSIYSDNEIGKLKIANSLWLQKDTHIKDAFINNTVQNFYTSVYNVNFSEKSAAELMSKWISENTNGKLSPKINISKEEVLSIINTIYLKDEWVDKFDIDKTKSDSFNLGDGSKVKCDFMNRTYEAYRFVKGDGFTSSSLGLKNSGSMIFVLPDKGVKMDDLFSTPEKVALLFNEDLGENGKVIFKIPKFSFGSNFDLNDTLKSMGVISAFKLKADFSGMTNDKIFISKIKQQTHITIDEKGVEAAAFTSILYCGSAAPNNKVAEMILDRPFIFAIKSNHGEILFVGIVNNPINIS